MSLNSTYACALQLPAEMLQPFVPFASLVLPALQGLEEMDKSQPSVHRCRSPYN